MTPVQPALSRKKLHPFIVILLGLVIAFGALVIFSRLNAEPPIATVTIAQTDAGTVNVWERLQDGRRVDQVEPGTQVKLIRREGRGRLIETPRGVRGWVLDEFIKE